MSEPQRRRKFDSQFNHDTLRMVQESNRRITDNAKKLEIRPELLYRWKNEQAADPEHAFPGKGNMKPKQDQVRRLEQELAQAKQERDIFKKVLTFFSRNER